MSAIAPARPSATIVVLRDGERHLEVLLLRRHVSTPAASGAYVFPGGGLSEPDRSLNPLIIRGAGPVLDDTRFVGDAPLAYYGAAARELFEEAGLLLASSVEGPADEVNLSQIRERCNGGAENFYDILSGSGLTLDLSGVRYFAHWLTPETRARRYDTRFFVVAAPPGQVASCDGIETVEAGWFRPDDALAAHARGEWTMLTPTRTVLAQLRQYATSVQALDALGATEVTRIMPREVERGGRTVVLVPGEPGYDDPTD